MRRLTNDEIAKNSQYGDFSLDQSRLAVEAFYDKMDDVMSPAPLDPMRAMKEVITSLEEQVKARVTSVENGRKFQNSGKGEAAMPDGPAIFETTGAWEDFATPSRDLRLLIAIDVVRHFPDRVARRPDRYAMPSGKSVADVKAELDSVLASELSARKFAYTRSDGSPWTLSVKDVVERVAAARDGLQPQRLRRTAVGRGGAERRGIDVQAPCAVEHSARRCRSTAPGSTSGAGRRAGNAGLRPGVREGAKAGATSGSGTTKGTVPQQQLRH